MASSQGNLGNTRLLHSEFVAEPSDSSTFSLHDNALATSFSVKLPIRDLTWPKDGANFPKSIVFTDKTAKVCKVVDKSKRFTTSRDRCRFGSIDTYYLSLGS